MISIINFIGYSSFALYVYFQWTFDAIEFPVVPVIFSLGGICVIGWYLDQKGSLKDLFPKLAPAIAFALFTFPQHMNFLVSTEYDGSYIVTEETKSTYGAFSKRRWELKLDNGKSIWVEKGGSEGDVIDLANLRLRRGVFGFYFSL